MLHRRPLIPCILAYIAGLWLAHDLYHGWPLGAIVVGFIIAFGSLAFSIWRRDSAAVALLIIMAAGAAVMGVREQRSIQADAIIERLEKSQPGVFVISGRAVTVTEFADTESARLVLADVVITSGTRSITPPGRLQVNIDANEMTDNNLPVSGERISFPGRVYKPDALNNFFGYDRLNALRHEQIIMAASPLNLNSIVKIEPDSGGIRSRIARRLITLRDRISKNLRRDMWPREGRLMVAMLFNDMRGLTQAEKIVFRDSQTFHLFAVSGMHVALLGLLLNMVFRVMRFGVRGSWIMVAVTLFFYLWLIDFVPSATRSYLMLAAFTAGYMLGREVDAITSLAFAVTAVIVFDPAALWKAGFELSVVGVAAVILFTPLIVSWMPWMKSDHDMNSIMTWKRQCITKFTALVAATIAVAIFLFPLQIYFFGFFNCLSPIANLLQALLAEAVLGAGILVAAVGLISANAGTLIGHSASAIMHVIYAISEITAQARPAILYFHQLTLTPILLAYAIMISGYYLTFRDSPEFRLKSRARFVTHSCCAVAVLFGCHWWGEWNRPPLEIWSLDVGQGDATLFRFDNGQTMLIDGGERDPDMGMLVVVPQLRGLGIDKLDYVVATHDDEDHTGGLASVIRSVQCDHLLIPKGMEAKSGSTLDMLAAARATGCRITRAQAGYQARAGSTTIDILNPQANAPPTQADNDSSVIVRVACGRFVGLFMGDAGFAAESRLINRRAVTGATLLKAGHHGSSSSTGEALLKAVHPRFAIISCGVHNNFGHPAPDLLRRLRLADCAILRTDKQGAIRIATDGAAITVKTRK